MEELSPDMLSQMGEAMVQGTPQARALGLELVSVVKAEAVLRCPYRAELVGDAETGVLAGGVVTTLLDHTCGLAVFAAMEHFSSTATLDLRIDYLRAAEPGLAIQAHAHCYKLTRSVAFVRAVAYERERLDPVATVQATFMLDIRRGHPESFL